MPTSKLSFRAPIGIRGINPYVLVSAGRAARLKPDWRKPMPVRIQVNGKPDVPWRINMMPAGDGSFFLYLHAQVRNASGTTVGDIVSVTIEFDGLYEGGPTDPMPSWFGKELRRNPKARQGLERLPPSRQKEIVRYLVRLKSAQAQQRNLQRALHVLAGGKARFMGRAWEGGR
jgi:hypothetical protein